MLYGVEVKSEQMSSGSLAEDVLTLDIGLKFIPPLSDLCLLSAIAVPVSQLM